MTREKAVVLVSGGLDSCLTAAIANQSYSPAYLHLNYGQKTEKREKKAFIDIAKHFQIKERLDVDVKHFSDIGGSSLTDDNMAVDLADLDREEIPRSYVPFRNANLLAIATS